MLLVKVLNPSNQRGYTRLAVTPCPSNLQSAHYEHPLHQTSYHNQSSMNYFLK